MLIAQGYGVQLEHSQEETTWEDHGFVRLTGPDGTVLAESSDIQHNRNFRNHRENFAKLIAALEDKSKEGVMLETQEREVSGNQQFS